MAAGGLFSDFGPIPGETGSGAESDSRMVVLDACDAGARSRDSGRRADVVGIFPNEASITRLIGAVLFEANDDWQTSSRYMMVEAFAQIDKEEIDPILSITTKAA